MISIKDVIDLGQRAFSAINGKRDTDERKRFEAGNDHKRSQCARKCYPPNARNPLF